MRAFLLLAPALLLAGAGRARGAPPDETPLHEGPISIGVLEPYGFLLFHLPSFDAEVPPAGQFELQIDETLVNNFIHSSLVDEVLERRIGREPFTRRDFDAIMAAHPGQDLYFFDGQVERRSLRATWSPAAGWLVGGEIPYIRRSGGGLDSVIESFHDTFGVPQDLRDRVDLDKSTAAVVIDGRRFFLTETGSTSGFGDPVLYLKWNPGRPIGGWSAAFGTGIKVPVGDEKRFFSTGKADVGVGFAASRYSGKWEFALDAGYVLPGSVTFLDDLHLSPVIAASASIGREGRSTSIWLQFHYEQSPFRHRTTTPLGSPIHEVSLGLRFPLLAAVRGYIAITENVFRFDNSSDIGLHVGLDRRFGRPARSRGDDPIR